MGSEVKESSKALLVLEHTSEEAHIEKLLAKQVSKPKIERLTSSVLQRVEQFLPNLHDTNRKRVEENSAEDAELCCELGENDQGPAIEMTLMVTREQDKSIKIVEALETNAAAAAATDESDSDNDDDDDDGDDEEEEKEKEEEEDDDDDDDDDASSSNDV